MWSLSFGAAREGGTVTGRMRSSQAVRCTPQKENTCLPPRGSLSTPRNKFRDGIACAEGGSGGPGSGAPVKPPSARKSSSASENLKGVAINFNCIVDIEAVESAKAGRAKAWDDNSSKVQVLLTPEPQQRRRLADLEDQQSFLRPIPLSFEPSSQFADSPDPTSKFHAGPSAAGPIPISPVTPGAPVPAPAAQVLSSHAFERFLASQKMAKQPESTARGECSSSSSNNGSSSSVSVPLIYGSNVTMDSPDPCSKFHSGPGPVPVSPLGSGVLASAFEPVRRSEETSMPLIHGSNVSVDSPDPISKFNKSHSSQHQQHQHQVVVSDAWCAAGSKLVGGGGNAVVEKAWRLSALVEEAENVKMDKWRVSPQPAKQQHGRASYNPHRLVRHNVVSPEEAASDALFNQTVSPMKPNYEQLCKQISQGAGKLPKATITVDVNQPADGKVARFARKVSPVSVTDDIFNQTLSPFKKDYTSKCDEINNTPNAKVKIDFESPRHYSHQSQLPVRPCPPPARPISDGSIAPRPPAFRRPFTGKDVSNTTAAAVAAALSSSAVAEGGKENVPSVNFRRGRVLKPAPSSMIERSDTDEVPLRGGSQELPASFASPLAQCEQQKQAEVLGPPARRPTVVRVSFLQCGYVSNTKTKQARKKKSRGAKLDLVLESVPENFPSLLSGWPRWLASVVCDFSAALSVTAVRRITNDGVVVPRTSCSTSEDEQLAILESIEQHEKKQQLQNLSSGGQGSTVGQVSSRLRKNLLAPLQASTTWAAKSDTYGLWIQRQKPASGDPEIFWAVYNGEVCRVKDFLANYDGGSLDDLRGAHGNTLLITAVLAGQLKIVKLCLKTGMSPDVANDFANTALHFAFELEHDNISDLLIRSGASFLRNAMGQNPNERITV